MLFKSAFKPAGTSFVLAVFLAAVFIMPFAGCSGTKVVEVEQPTQAASAVPTVEPITEPVTEPAEPTAEPTAEVLISNTRTSESRHAEYLSAAEALLSGKADDIDEFRYGCSLVFFGLEGEELVAYSTQTVKETVYNDGSSTREYSLEDPLASYPCELFALVSKRLGEIGQMHGIWSGAPVPTEMMRGLIGEDFVVFLTVDDSMQDLQASCIFRNVGGEWVEIGDNNDNVVNTMFGAGFANDEVGFLCYYSKQLVYDDISTGKLFVWRTGDNGESWHELDIDITEYFPDDEIVYSCALSPVFDGDHGVMCVTGMLGSGLKLFNLWLETFDLGLSWRPITIG